ncbi:polysaccharide deacetylase family protein [Paenibacillus kobensis]|uniref:polysaccharide deacetylase family protein n=1 Tax=Paenibacillus kobensis TaxID=59841 RepID=UPI001FE98D21|nr:polysaccharide deacetylase family protein [Paenibacillus kobensis]
MKLHALTRLLFVTLLLNITIPTSFVSSEAAAVPSNRVLPSSSTANHSDTAAAVHETAAAQETTAAQETANANETTAAPRRSAAISWVTLERNYPGVFVTHGPRGKRKAALTFDDVPDPRYTGKVLDVLARYHVQATFFVLGSLAARHPALVKRMQREGHTVGNHSYNHALFSQLSQEQFRRQIVRTDAVLTPLIGYSPRFIRPPYGEVRPKQLQWARRNGYIVVNWDVDSVDWRSLRSRTVILNIRKTIQPGSIILQHAGGGPTQDLSGTVEALPRIIRLLQSKGYELVTVPELLGASPER